MKNKKENTKRKIQESEFKNRDRRTGNQERSSNEGTSQIKANTPVENNSSSFGNWILVPETGLKFQSDISPFSSVDERLFFDRRGIKIIHLN